MTTWHESMKKHAIRQGDSISGLLPAGKTTEVSKWWPTILGKATCYKVCWARKWQVYLNTGHTLTRYIQLTWQCLSAIFWILSAQFLASSTDKRPVWKAFTQTSATLKHKLCKKSSKTIRMWALWGLWYWNTKLLPVNIVEYNYLLLKTPGRVWSSEDAKN